MTVKELMKKTQNAFENANLETFVERTANCKFPHNVNITGAPVVSFRIENDSSNGNIYIHAFI